MNTTEPKPQTPLTDAEKWMCHDCGHSDRKGGPRDTEVVSSDFARSLELKLQETKLWIEKSNTAQYALELEEKLQEAENNLRLIGDMAVVEWDDTTVGKVDAIVKGHPPQTYIDKVRNLYKRAQEAEQLEIKLAEVERQRDEAKAAYTKEVNEHQIWHNTCHKPLEAERDLLIKVADAANNIVSSLTHPHEVCWLEEYSLLPHVQAKKGNKQ